MHMNEDDMSLHVTYSHPTLDQLTFWRHSAIWSLACVPRSHSSRTHSGTERSVLLRFSAIMRLILALAARQSFSSQMEEKPQRG